MKNKIKFLPIITTMFFVLSAIFFSIFAYYDVYYGDVETEQLMFTLMKNEGTSPEMVKAVLPFIVIPAIIFITIFLYIYFSSRKGFTYKAISTKTKRWVAFILSIVMLFSTTTALFNSIGIGEFISYQFKDSTFIEDNYVNPKTTNIVFPENKKNVILLFTESMESSFASKEDGGILDVNVIPELTKLANENVHFSNTNKLGGALSGYGTTWTTAGIVAHTFGLPLKTLPNDYGDNESFLPNAYTLFEILKDNGYNLLSTKGSDIEFGGLGQMLKDHGNISHYDYYAAVEDGKIPEDYYRFWGYEDKKLFEYVKEQATELSSKSEPFMLMIETVDTHFPDGYVCDDCKTVFGDQYSNVLNCSDKQIYNFVEWCKTQMWYEDTVIIITGDHLTMKSNYIVDDDSYTRTTYNCFINSAITPDKSVTQNRQFGTIDMFPTILAAMGCKIEGEKLGLGTNLFSKSQTLYEKYGYDFVDKELRKKSMFYTSDLM